MSGLLPSTLARLLRIPGEPEPPPGDASQVRVFRAGQGYYRHKLLRWAIGQVAALGALVVGLVIGGTAIGDFGVPLFGLFGGLAWIAFLAQMIGSYLAVRLDYQMRWYILAANAMRIREGVLTVRELTVAYANVQKLSVRQGPLQRLFGIGDVEVRTAGGASREGRGSSPGWSSRSWRQSAAEDTHRAYFAGVDLPEEIRDLILDRVRLVRDSGLGDPDEDPRSTRPHGQRPSLSPAGREAVLGAQLLLEQARELRLVMSTRPD